MGWKSEGQWAFNIIILKQIIFDKLINSRKGIVYV